MQLDVTPKRKPEEKMIDEFSEWIEQIGQATHQEIAKKISGIKKSHNREWGTIREYEVYKWISEARKHLTLTRRITLVPYSDGKRASVGYKVADGREATFFAIRSYRRLVNYADTVRARSALVEQRYLPEVISNVFKITERGCDYFQKASAKFLTAYEDFTKQNKTKNNQEEENVVEAKRV